MVLPNRDFIGNINTIPSEKYIVYVRVSTDRDEQMSSVPNQIDVCRYWLERNGIEWDEDSVYKDEGISGTVLLERDAMQIVLEKAKRKEISMVVFKSLNRLARDTKDALEIREVLTSHNVRIISVEEGYDSFRVSKNDMSYEMSSLFAEQYSRMLSVNISGVLAAKVRRGEHIGKTPFGYDKINKKLHINTEEAETIVKIFDWYNSGIGYKKITDMLNEELKNGGVKPKLSETWQITTIQTIIKNPIYFGTFILNKYRHEKVAGRKKQIKNPPEKWLIFENQHPAIISRETWEKANNKKVINKKRKITPWNEFRGIAKCSECGSNMIIVQSWKKKKNGEKTRWAYLKCSQYRRAGHSGCVNHAPIQYKDLRAFIIDRLLEKGKSVQFNFESDFESRRQNRVLFLKKKIEQSDSKKKDLLDLYLDKFIAKDEFEEKRREIEVSMEQWEEELFLLQKKEHLESKIRNIREAFTVLENQDQDLYSVFKNLISDIIMHPDGIIDIKYTFQNTSGYN